MIRNILGTSRFLIILAVLGTFVASATLQVFGLLGFGLAVGAVIVAVGVLTWATRAQRSGTGD